ncbi:MAG: flagellar hook assembly protein FlgD [Planctomycetota bacterium]
MSATNGITGMQGQQVTTGYDPYKNLDTEAFLKMLVTELQNQDPLNPMDNTQLLTQISQIREITSNDRLSETMEAVTLGQKISTATALLGWNIKGLDDSAKEIEGQVERISIQDNEPKVIVGDSTVSLKNIREVVPAW